MAERMARLAGLDLDSIPGSGVGGRVQAEDVIRALPENARRSASPQAEQAGAREHDYVVEDRPAAAQGLRRATREAERFSVRTDCDAQPIVAMRHGLDAWLPEKARVTLFDLFLFLSARALARVPALDALWSRQEITRSGRIDLAFAVAVDGAMVTPVIADAAAKRLSEIAESTRRLTESAQARQLRPEDYSGDAFMVSNLGRCGGTDDAAAVSASHAAILAINAPQNEHEAPSRVELTLFVDPSVADRIAAAKFLEELKLLVEEPRRLLL
jgi:pyruvate dehydrogenase E2 component (dihydrolipoamide acetyltransferase)